MTGQEKAQRRVDVKKRLRKDGFNPISVETIKHPTPGETPDVIILPTSDAVRIIEIIHGLFDTLDASVKAWGNSVDRINELKKYNGQ